MRKTVKCRLLPTDEQAVAILLTMEAFADAANDVLSHEPVRRNRFGIRRDHYSRIKSQYGLNANYVMRVCYRVAESFGRNRPKSFRPTSLTIDDHLCTFFEHTESVSLSTITGRLRMPVAIGQYQRAKLAGFKFGPGTVTYDRRTRQFFVNFCITVATPEPSGAAPLGVDLGINRIATTSDGQMFSGRSLNRRRERYARTRASLNKKGTKGSKRTLKRLSGREARFQRDVNHQISRTLVDGAKSNDQYIVLEDLTGITTRCNNKGKRMRRIMGRWAFYQLRQFITYKAEERGVALRFVNPRNTSKTCPACKSFGHRKKHRFSCSCGFVGDADLVGATNIAAQGALPIAPQVA